MVDLRCNKLKWLFCLFEGKPGHDPILGRISVTSRLLHSPSLVKVGLSVGYHMTWPPIGWHHHFVIDWSSYWDCLSCGLKLLMGISTIFRWHWQSPSTVLMAGKLPAAWVVQGDCEELTHWGRDKMDAISQTTFSNAFSWMKVFESRLKFHWN